MDKLARKLREDAASIDAEISAQLDSRVRASLNAIEPARAPEPIPRRRPVSLWWASSLTGVAAALLIIAILNVAGRDEPVVITEPVAANTVEPIEIPVIDLDVQAATLTGPLAQELEDLQADLKRAEEMLRADVRIDF